MPVQRVDTNDPLYQGFIKSRFWMPTGAIDENSANRQNTGSTVSPNSGTMMLTGGLVIPNGVTCTGVGFRCVAAPVGPTNGWLALVRQSDLLVLTKTADDLTVGWPTTAITRSWTTPFTPTVDTAVYVGIVTVAGTAATISGYSVQTQLGILPPIMGGPSSTGLTTPASLGANATAITAAGLLPYAYLF